MIMPTEREAHPFTLNFGGWDDPEIVAARLFGKLVELAEGVVTEYRNDLYRDALQLQKFVPDMLIEARERGGSDLYWAARTHGTLLDRYREGYFQGVGILGRVFGYRIIIRHHGYTDFSAEFIPDTEPYEALPLTRGGEH